jgi:hypothetical protein
MCQSPAKTADQKAHAAPAKGYMQDFITPPEKSAFRATSCTKAEHPDASHIPDNVVYLRTYRRTDNDKTL